MRLAKEILDQRLLMIIGAALRFVRNGNAVETLPVACWVKQYGFTANFSKTAELTVALKGMIKWVDQSRFATGKTPEPQALVKFIKSKLYHE